MPFNGFDISAIQGVPNWTAIKSSGATFVVLRCGIGNDSIDKNYAHNVAAAKSAGLSTACYHFVYPLPPATGKPSRDPVAQAQYHFNASLGEVMVCDLEWPLPKDWATWGCSASQIKTWAQAYLTEYERLSGRKPMIYTYPDFCANVKFTSDFTQYPLWIASYESTPAIPAPWTNYVLWQKGQGPLPGTGVNTDLDECPDLSIFSTAAPSVINTPPVDIYNAPPPVDIYSTPAPTSPIPVPPPAQPTAPTTGTKVLDTVKTILTAPTQAEVSAFTSIFNFIKNKFGR
jgi:GH25 family lysozyme M1 (1,4-beta-N-acetylmuramidase)